MRKEGEKGTETCEIAEENEERKEDKTCTWMKRERKEMNECKMKSQVKRRKNTEK